MFRTVLSHSSMCRLRTARAGCLLLLLGVLGVAACQLTGPNYRKVERVTLTGRVTEAADSSFGIPNVRVMTLSQDAALDDWGDLVETRTDSTGHYVIAFKRYCGEEDLHLVMFSGTGWAYQGHEIPCSQSRLDVQMEQAPLEGPDASTDR